MIEHTKNREDISRFLTHLTREYEKIEALDNLVNILKHKKIEARNIHCLFKHQIEKLDYDDDFKKYFHTVCLTETPLHQIRILTSDIKREVKLQPYGLVFLKDRLLQKAANPAIYISSNFHGLDIFLIEEFDNFFKDVDKINQEKKGKEFTDLEKKYYKKKIYYFSLINKIGDNYDFTWEREWRVNGDLEFEYTDIVAILAQDLEKFNQRCKTTIQEGKFKEIESIPIINPAWSYEDIIEQMSTKIKKLSS
ncbi:MULTISPECIES: abortive infection system antitoxin AbiGi family protein [Cyanophyceae]|uniref:abortive infection system antitoxin AbiGi family protein n=1 Tax=Cyanophyceae TaxID=3028117 RepID=UPI0016892574|nr:abortive infection system antitoxin AbiGi family protein [Trichocoleus sp. FACHB-69]MBD1931722.1 hypothetical protein [Trichocoleus sp. FACHB-69]